MSAHSPSWSGYQIVSASFGLAGLVSLGLIPGIGLLLLGGALLVWLAGAMMERSSRKLTTGGLWVAFAVSLTGLAVIFYVGPFVGLGVLLAGLGLTAGIAVYQWLETACDGRRRPTSRVITR